MHTLMYEKFAGLYPLFRETLKGSTHAAQREVNFIADVLAKSRQPIRSLIDLGGGIGMHAGPLTRLGYRVTVYDRSKQALQCAKKKYPQLNTIHGSLETINLRRIFDAAICMWSTFPYIIRAPDRRRFFRWIRTHIKHLIVLDEPNFHHYLKIKEFHKLYPIVKNNSYSMRLTRDWIITPRGFRKSSYVYTITSRATGERLLIQDGEQQQFITAHSLKKLLGHPWRLKKLLGDYEMRCTFDQHRSPRLITLFEQNHARASLPLHE